MDLDHAVAQLMEPPRRLDLSAVRLVLAFEEILSPPLTVPVTFVSHVQPGAEVKARFGHRSEMQPALLPVLELEFDVPFHKAPIVGAEDEPVLDVLEKRSRSARKLDPPSKTWRLQLPTECLW